MVSKPGRMQAAWTAGELDPFLHDRTQIKYTSTGADHMENVVSIPQGGFRFRGGLRDVGQLEADAERLLPFMASDGSVYDIVLRPGEGAAWSQTSELASFAISGLTSGMLRTVTDAQRLDTMLLFHQDLRSKRVKHGGPTSWSVDDLPYVEIPSYDYGGPIGGGDYTNGVSAVWRLEFVGLTSGTSVFTLTVSQQETVSIGYDSDMTVLAAAIQAAILDLPNVADGVTAVSDSGGASGTKINITFDGAGNEGDGWAVSGVVINKADAAILSSKTTVGVAPGEPVISNDRGWPRCGAFYNQRLEVGGFKSLPNAWMFSKRADYFNYDIRFSGASGPALVPMDTDGGEAVERIVSSRNLAIFTNRAEYWIDERGLSQTEPPNHVQAGERGVKAGVPIIANEGALNYVSATGSVIGEFRYTDVEGNFVSRDVSLLAAHLITDVKDQSIRRAEQSRNGNLNAIIQEDGGARLATILREQDVMAVCRMTSGAASFKATSVNGRNEAMFIVDRPDSRRLERLEDDLLLDEATDFEFGEPSFVLEGLNRFVGREVWVVGDGHVMGPFVPETSTLTLPFSVSSGYFGSWSPPIVTTLPPPRDIGPNTVLRRRARLHSAHISLIDSTSLAISANGGPVKEIPLQRYGLPADVPELQQGVTGIVSLRGLTGFDMEPKLTITQTRPGRLTVRSVTLEYKL